MPATALLLRQLLLAVCAAALAVCVLAYTGTRQQRGDINTLVA